MTKLIATLVLLAAPLLAGAEPFTVIEVDTRKAKLELFLNDEVGKPFRRLDRLDAWLKSKHRQLEFAPERHRKDSTVDLGPIVGVVN